MSTRPHSRAYLITRTAARALTATIAALALIAACSIDWGALILP